MRDSLTAAQRDEMKRRAQSATGHGRWSGQMLLLAEITDQLQWVRHALYAANSKNGTTNYEVRPVPRPGVEPTARKTQWGTVASVVTEERIERLRKLRADRGLPDGGD